MDSGGTQVQNPDVPMDDWTIIKEEQPQNNSMTFLLAISEEGVVALEKQDHKLFFGVREAKVKVFRPQGPDGGDVDDIDSANMVLDKMQLVGPTTSTNNQ